jgi:hypothetical protein
MFRLHRSAPAVALMLVAAAMLAPTAQARPAAAAAGGGGSATAIDRHAHDTPLANPVSIPATLQGAPASSAKAARQSDGGTDWNAFFAGAAGSAVIIAMFAGGLGLVRRRTLAA